MAQQSGLPPPETQELDDLGEGLQRRPNESVLSDEPVVETQLSKQLKERHVNMIALSACIGVGLFLQSGRVIYLAGPGMAVFAYLLSGSIMWSTVASLGEMTAVFPLSGGLFIFPCRFVDEGVGYACGWMTWFSWTVIIASELLAVAELWKFKFSQDYLVTNGYNPDETIGWEIGQRYIPVVWVTLFWILILVVNCLPVRWFGRLEYIFGCLKLIFIVGLIMFNIVVSGLKRGDRDNLSRTWTYEEPYSFASKNITLRVDPNREDNIVGGSFGVFLAFWSAMTTTIFSMIGFETVSITAAENKHLEKTEAIKLGSRKIAIRIVTLYSLAVLAVGLNVPYTDPNLRDLTINSIRSGQNSVFILSAVLNHIRGWPNFFNAFFIFSATTSGINSLYISSRVLHALASIPEVWPLWGLVEKFRAKLEHTKVGVPYFAVFISWLFGSLAYLATKPFPAIELGRMATNSVVSMLIVYTMVCWSFLRFHTSIQKAAAGMSPRIEPSEVNANLRAYDRDSEIYAYRSRGQRGRAWYGLIGCTLLAVFNGWRSFTTTFSLPDFIAAYIGFPIFGIIVLLYHIKLDGWNPSHWKFRANKDLERPRPMIVKRGERRGRLRLENPNKLTLADLAAFVHWIWVWLK